MKTLLRRAVLGLAAACLLPAAAAADAGLAIAGRSATLEQAVSVPHAGNYRLLIRGKELRRITDWESDDELRALLQRARRGGAVLFACQSDLRAQDLRPADLPPGVLLVDALDVWENGAPSAADRRLRTICS